jgi:hypothetical protein
MAIQKYAVDETWSPHATAMAHELFGELDSVLLVVVCNASAPSI